MTYSSIKESKSKMAAKHITLIRLQNFLLHYQLLETAGTAINMPQQTVSNFHMGLNDKWWYQWKVRVAWPLQEHLQNVYGTKWREAKNRDWWPSCILEVLPKSNPFITNWIVFVSFGNTNLKVNVTYLWKLAAELMNSDFDFRPFPWP